ncbi:MAG: flagellar biosynthesis protein FlhF [Burkholderiales bacterium]|jgi:flagellar biosynthesis protein FlhF|nr:flagellar biosynthesis protein FlhF [Betaproteobacteria bacterium]
MIVRKFVASSTREALRLVRDTLGADAIILSNRTVDGEIEVMAVAEADFDGSMPVVNASPLATGTPRQEAQVFRNARVRPRPVPAATTPTEASAPDALAGAVVSDLLAEVRSLKQLVESQLSGFAWGEVARQDPSRAEALRQWLAAGFSPGLGRVWLEQMTPGLSPTEICAGLRLRLHRELQGRVVESDLVEESGTFALVGPTGVGKTTTVAKIGARCAMRHGSAQVAFVTTDSYRVGAEDQLRVYAKLLGAPVFAARDGAELDVTLEDIRRRRLVLVDTIGMGQRDQRLADQLQLLTGAGHGVKRILVIAANTQLSTLEDVIQRYGEGGLYGCILTKIDEAVRLGEILDVVVRHNLPVHYLSNGQRVPEDLHRPNPLYLADRAFRSVGRLPPFEGRERDELALYTAALETRFDALDAT